MSEMRFKGAAECVINGFRRTIRFELTDDRILSVSVNGELIVTSHIDIDLPETSMLDRDVTRVLSLGTHPEMSDTRIIVVDYQIRGKSMAQAVFFIDDRIEGLAVDGLMYRTESETGVCTYTPQAVFPPRAPAFSQMTH